MEAEDSLPCPQEAAVSPYLTHYSNTLIYF